MTNRKALEILKTEWKIDAEIFDTDFYEALELAIKAFEFIEENFPKTFIDYLNGVQI